MNKGTKNKSSKREESRISSEVKTNETTPKRKILISMSEVIGAIFGIIAAVIGSIAVGIEIGRENLFPNEISITELNDIQKKQMLKKIDDVIVSLPPPEINPGEKYEVISDLIHIEGQLILLRQIVSGKEIIYMTDSLTTRMEERKQRYEVLLDK